LSNTSVQERDVAKKKIETTKRYGTLIRVSDKFADILRSASQAERMSMAEFADAYLFAITEKRYRDFVLREAKRIGGTGP
jgi:hypothetical protein